MKNGAQMHLMSFNDQAVVRKTLHFQHIKRTFISSLQQKRFRNIVNRNATRRFAFKASHMRMSVKGSSDVASR
jgi:hypothetical protein